MIQREINLLLQSDNVRTFLLSLLIGILAAFGVHLYHLLIEAFQILFQDLLAAQFLSFLAPFGLVAALALAGALVGWLYGRFVGGERHHGVAGIIESVALSGGRLPYGKLPFKALMSALSLGAGASTGPEDPSVQIGANIGAFLADRLHLPEENARLLVAAGGASAVAAAFQAPIAGVFFALEIILNGAFTAQSFGVVVLGAVIAAAVNQLLSTGVAEALGPLTYTLGTPLEIVLYVPLALLLAPAAAGFVKLVYWQHDLWHEHVRLPRPLKTALAGALVALVGSLLPQILGVGRTTMNGVLAGDLQFPLLLLLLLACAKMLMTAVTLAGGFIGGVFAPTLFIGTMVGAAYGQAAALLFGGTPQAYAIAGMAGMMAGVLRAPITAVMIVFEMTGDYRLILPMMLTTTLCMALAERWQPDGIYTHGLARAGLRLHQGRDVDIMQGVTVREAMHTPPATIAENASLDTLRDVFKGANTRALCVVDAAGQLTGIVTLRDLQTCFDHHGENTAALRVHDVCVRQVITAAPDETLWQAVRRMGEHHIGRLPVVDPLSGALLGVLRRHNIVDAYEVAVTRRAADMAHAQRIRLNNLTGMNVLELRVRPGAPVCNCLIREVSFPRGAIIAQVRREGRLLTPHGDTVLQAGDRLVVVSDVAAAARLRTLVGDDDMDVG